MKTKAKVAADECCHVNRIPVEAGRRAIGAVSIGKCKKPCVPEMTVCLEHADKEAMLLVIRGLKRDAFTLSEWERGALLGALVKSSSKTLAAIHERLLGQSSASSPDAVEDHLHPATADATDALEDATLDLFCACGREIEDAETSSAAECSFCATIPELLSDVREAPSFPGLDLSLVLEDYSQELVDEAVKRKLVKLEEKRKAQVVRLTAKGRRGS